MDDKAMQERLEKLVHIVTDSENGPVLIRLEGLDCPSIELGPYENPDLAKHDVKHLRDFLVAFHKSCQ